MLAHGAYTLQSEPLLDGDDGTAQTIARIRELVDHGKKDPFVNHLTGTLLRRAGVRPYDDAAEIRAIFEWVLRNIRFTKDPEGKECLRPARTTLEWGFGDCDDINAILLPSMLGTVGHATRVITIASHPGAPKQFTHVYCEVFSSGRWIPLDAARRGTRFGVAPERHSRKRAWALDANTYQDLRGLACGACQGGCAMRRRAALGTHLRLGRMYRASALGDFDWGDFSDIAGSVGKAVTSVVAAARAPAGVVYPSMSVYPPVGPVLPPGGGVSAVGSVSSKTLMIGGALLLGVVLLARRP